MVLTILSQGVYNDPSSIVILCTYLGQLTKIREALASCKLSVVLDERDEKLLADADAQDESAPSTKEVDVSKQASAYITLRNYFSPLSDSNQDRRQLSRLLFHYKLGFCSSTCRRGGRHHSSQHCEKSRRRSNEGYWIPQGLDMPTVSFCW